MRDTRTHTHRDTHTHTLTHTHHDTHTHTHHDTHTHKEEEEKEEEEEEEGHTPLWERHFQRQDNSRRKKVYQRKFPNCLVFPKINQDKTHARLEERERGACGG